MQKISFLMNGSSGRMGRALALGLGSRENMRLAAAVDTKPAAVDYGLLCGLGQLGLQQEQDLAAAIRREKPDVPVGAAHRGFAKRAAGRRRAPHGGGLAADGHQL